jgi:hypothetical protein
MKQQLKSADIKEGFTYVGPNGKLRHTVHVTKEKVVYRLLPEGGMFSCSKQWFSRWAQRELEGTDDVIGET